MTYNTTPRDHKSAEKEYLIRGFFFGERVPKSAEKEYLIEFGD
jgi:hypothetical protein